ncbi:MAG TPA: hypothetical protein PLN18_00680 [Candidatus Colwellbacteria bacterium]|nr:hypothetical protein [Candidatus Colwellbacteria bacterium]
MKRKSLLLIFLAAILLTAFLGSPAIVSAQDAEQTESSSERTSGGRVGTGEEQSGSLNCTLSLLSLNLTNILTCLLTNFVIEIVRAFVWLSTALIDGAIALNETIYGPNSLAKAGFDVVLQFVNIFFVFGILTTGFATMLRPVFPNFGLLNKIGKERLPQLLLAFFLVNFAFTLAGAIISLSDNITRSLNQMISSSNAWEYFGALPMDGMGNIESAFGLFVVPILTALVGVGIILTMFAIAIMFFIRWAYLTFLVIISPFVIFMEVFPVITFKNLGSFKNWSEQFVRWLLFAPVMILFIYIILSLSSAGLDTTANTVFGASLGLYVGKMILQLILLVIGLQWANSLSLGGGKVVFGTANTLLNRAKNFPIREGKTLGTILGQRVTDTPQYKQVRSTLAGSFITRPLAVQMDVATARLKTGQEKSIKEYGENYKDWSNETLIRYLDSANLSLMNPVAQTALLQQLQNRKIAVLKEEDVTKAGLDKNRLAYLNGQIGRLIGSARGIKATDAFKKTHPHEISDYKTPKDPKEIEKAAEKITKAVRGLKPSEILDVVPEAFQEWPVVLGLNESHFRKLGDEGSDEQRTKIEDTLKSLVSDPTKTNKIADIVKRLRRIPSWAEFGEELNKMLSASATPPKTTPPARPTSSTIITPGPQPKPGANIITPGPQPNPQARIITPGAQPQPKATVVTPGPSPKPGAKIVTPGPQPNPEAGIINPYRKQPDVKINIGKEALEEAARRRFLDTNPPPADSGNTSPK